MHKPNEPEKGGLVTVACNQDFSYGEGGEGEGGGGAVKVN